MPRSIWKGAISFGLVTIPVKLYSATEEKDISFRQVHAEDGGRIRYKRVCEKDGEEIPYPEIAKGYELPDGRMVILQAEDFEALPLATTKSVEVVQFVDDDEVDPTYFNKTYFLQADGPGVKPYVLLRDALTKSGQSAVVKVALR
ncbi:MAG TPA: Ku protein, partial [Propionibacteriaceae bacterium]|nr:Ku protein [Propionibacteriaceae bacterium]